MPVLKEGSSGAAVRTLQARLIKLGFKPGIIDGKFGPLTKKAVIAFQKSRKLRPDGLVGPKTQAALAPRAVPVKRPVKVRRKRVKDLTPLQVARMFPGTPLANIEVNLPYVMTALKASKLDDRDMVLMALATIRAETGNFTPLSEYKSKYNTTPKGHPFNRYDNRTDLGNLGPPDGERFRGRGYIQLTGRANYQEHGAAIGLGNQLIENPLLANQPDIAARLLASFLKSKEQLIRNALTIGDLKTARRLVNGGSHGLAQFTQAFNVGKTVIRA
jgi:peptidoglycan L-alanyl-D-glutamate endopeptidase CwlK